MEAPMTTVIHEDRETDVAPVRPAGESLWLSRDEVHRATGWTLRPEGLCQGDVCVPVPRGREAEFIRGDAVDLAAFWRHMGYPVVRDDAARIWVLGVGAAARSDALQSLEAPEFTLPDLEGRRHSLSEQRGKKVLLVTWASW
jgi:hypothetical protein